MPPRRVTIVRRRPTGEQQQPHDADNRNSTLPHSGHSSLSSSSSLSALTDSQQKAVETGGIFAKFPSLGGALSAILNGEKWSQTTLTELYNDVEDCVMGRMGGLLYSGLEVALREHISGVTGPRLRRAVSSSSTPSSVPADPSGNTVSTSPVSTTSSNSGSGSKSAVSGSPAHAILFAVRKEWEMHCDQMMVVRSIFNYLDRTYVLQSSKRTLWDLGLQFFRSHVLGIPADGDIGAESAEVLRRTLSSFLTLVEADRRDEDVDRELMRSTSLMLVTLGAYSSYFEPRFIQQTRSFYQLEARQYLRDATSFQDIARYLHQVHRRIREELDERLRIFLDASTRGALQDTLDAQLIAVHGRDLIDRGFAGLAEEGNVADVGLLYALLQRPKELAHAGVAVSTRASTTQVESSKELLEHLRSAVRQYTQQVSGLLAVPESIPGSAPRAAAGTPQAFVTIVQSLLDFKSRMDKLLMEAFANNDRFIMSFREGMEVGINVVPQAPESNNVAEFLSKFLDAQLRSAKGKTEEELDSLVDAILEIFRFVNDKTKFQAFYQNLLGKRLLLEKSASVDLEKSVISKLKAECGPSFTNKLEGMFKDMDLSKDLTNEYKESDKRVMKSDMELHVYVLTQGFWPNFPTVEITLPVALTMHMEAFKGFYLHKHNGRRLQWQHYLGNCVVKATLKSKKKELVVSLLQATLLLCFNDADEDSGLGLEMLEEQTGLKGDDLKRNIASMALGKVRILKRVGTGVKDTAKSISDDDKITINEDFRHKLFRIRINGIQIKQTKQEHERVTQAVHQDRQHQIDAAIVRIMKARKKLVHSQLIQEVLGQLKGGFSIAAADIKKRIESLIDREFLRRGEDNKTYEYLA